MLIKTHSSSSCVSLLCLFFFKPPRRGLFFSIKVFFLNGDHFFKVFIEFVKILLQFYVWFFGREACGILVPLPGVEPVPAALKSKVLTTGPLGKSLSCVFFTIYTEHFPSDIWGHQMWVML